MYLFSVNLMLCNYSIEVVVLVSLLYTQKM